MRNWFPLIAGTLPLLTECATGKPGKEFFYLEETPVRITEIHYAPSVEQGHVEFIEVVNVTDDRIELSGWQVTGAGRVVLPSGTRLEPREVIVLSQDLAAFRQAFGTSTTPIARLSGKLRNKGEAVRVEDPHGRVADEVSYDAADPEVEKAAGTGWSLHRVSFSSASAGKPWTAAKPSPGTRESNQDVPSRR